ncbi:membrane protein [Vibrio coralliilyticus]|uniref:Membrane protein n=1 Tax=Vibrio coralliilyticus TaxID=190893 RepID=A0A837GAN0_9VIBR|nr:TerC family protein [Vibrio coralliilyticus]KJY67970.1 membrane protein [Vibrio coralliilyticus]QOU32098.1 TerC family protein [Vibrio coralliilyticus]
MNLDIAVIFGTLLALEIILGVDNIVFISILSERLPIHLRRRVQNLGIGLAVVSRIGLVFSISWLMSLTEPLLTISEYDFTGKALILLLGGLFLLLKSLHELWHWLGAKTQTHSRTLSTGVAVIILQIIAVDAVFSIDSIITAVGLTNDINIMIAAIIISALIMMVFADKIQGAISKYPGLKTLALLFLVLLGGLLIAEGVGIMVNKGYVYVAMAFGLILEGCHILLSKRKASNSQVNGANDLNQLG